MRSKTFCTLALFAVTSLATFSGCASISFRLEAIFYEMHQRIAERLQKAVVRIEVLNNPTKLNQGKEAGTAFFYKHKNLLVTCAHLIQDTLQPTIYIYANNRKARVSLVYMDTVADVALIQVGERDSAFYADKQPLALHTAAIGVAHRIYMVGFPSNEFITDSESTVRSGIVTAINRTLSRETKTLGPFIEIDAYASEGLSGSPVCDSYGRVVGMVNFVYSTSEGVWLGSTYITPIYMIDEIVNTYLAQMTRKQSNGKAE